jgi:phosphoribosylglycinamide formyltransferase-1
MARVAVFASGTGSNFKAIHRHLQLGGKHRLCCLVSDKPQCGAVEYARDNGIAFIGMNYAKGASREALERQLITDLALFQPDLLVLAGFMRLLSPVLIDAFPKAIINIHPTLLPRFPGAHGIAESFASDDRILGITIHHVDYGVDTGPIILQKSFERQGTESLEEIERKLHELEHASYPAVVSALLDHVRAGS